MLLGCGGTPQQDPSNIEGARSEPQWGAGGIHFIAADDYPLVLARFRGEDLGLFLADRDSVREALDAAASAGPVGTQFVRILGGTGRVLLDGPLPSNFGRPAGLECTVDTFAAVDTDGELVLSVEQGLCGMEHTELWVRFGPDGVEIGDWRFIEDPQPPAPPGVVAIDRPAARGFEPGMSPEVDLTPVPDDRIAPRPFEAWEPLRPVVCFDVTVHAGSVDDGGQVVPEVVIADGGDPIPIPVPEHQLEPRVITQDPDSTVVWSFGPIDLDQHQPDSITVTASEGEIASWDVSARHC